MNTNYCYTSNAGIFRVGGYAINGSGAGMASINLSGGQFREVSYPGYKQALPYINEMPRHERITRREAIKDLYRASEMGFRRYKA